MSCTKRRVTKKSRYETSGCRYFWSSVFLVADKVLVLSVVRGAMATLRPAAGALLTRHDDDDDDDDVLCVIAVSSECKCRCESSDDRAMKQTSSTSSDDHVTDTLNGDM